MNYQNTDKYVLHPDQCKFIYNIAYLSLFSSLYATYKKLYFMACCPGGVFITSIYYWKNPTFDSPRRYIDIGFLSLALGYQIYTAYYSQYIALYYSIMLCAVSFYPLGYYFYNRNLYWKSTYAHCMIHIIANIGNIILYSGEFNNNNKECTNSLDI